MGSLFDVLRSVAFMKNKKRGGKGHGKMMVEEVVEKEVEEEEEEESSANLI